MGKIRGRNRTAQISPGGSGRTSPANRGADLPRLSPRLVAPGEREVNGSADQNPKERAGAVDEHITRRRGTRRDERLVILIRRRKDQGRHEGHCSPTPKAAGDSAQSAKDQPGKNGVLNQVRRLAHEEVNVGDRIPRHIRLQPAEKWSEKARSLLGRHQLG